MLVWYVVFLLCRDVWVGVLDARLDAVYWQVTVPLK